MPFNWECPFCERSQSVVAEKYDVTNVSLSVGKTVEGMLGVQIRAIGCANPQCRQTTVSASLGAFKIWQGSYVPDPVEQALFERRIYPEGTSKVLPDYIPKAIRDDYREACLIRDLSPKASATLARRCLQGMIRNFAKPKTKSDKLFAEIQALEVAIADGSAPREISAASVAAMTAVRKVGNIGAHMEADVDVIVDVDAGEAQVLINLIEALLQDWYVEREKRTSLFGATIALADQKTKQLADARAHQAALPSPAATGNADGSAD